MILVFSANSNASPQIKREIERAANKGVTVVPFRIDDVLPSKTLEYFISTQHWLDAFTPPCLFCKRLASLEPRGDAGAPCLTAIEDNLPWSGPA